ncbi:hypothetical protein HMPREF1556_00936 [Porphyromonas sp. oral taxon 278 str. W7784]|nr:hypothetical protein HMPREF1556_00936 [Porphyromonas sp. oral taxon 278 str. W7784]
MVNINHRGRSTTEQGASSPRYPRLATYGRSSMRPTVGRPCDLQ